MEIKIGILHSPREIVLDTDRTPDQIAKMTADAVAAGGTVTFEDVRGRRLILSAEKLAYVEIAESKQRRVGFGG